MREKLTKRDRRIQVADYARKVLQKAMAGGFKLWRPGEVVEMSDRSYFVQPDGSWKRLRAGDVIRVGRFDFEVGADGKRLTRMTPRAA